MTYETLSIIAALFEKEKNGREKECELLREKLNTARDKLELSPNDSKLSHEVEFSDSLYQKARRSLLKLERASEEFLEHNFR